MKLLISTLVLCLVMSFGAMSAQAAVLVLKGKGGETVTLESAPDLGADMYLVKMDGVDSAWAGKVFAVKKQVYGESDRYGFDYTVDLSSGPQEKSYQILVETDGTLASGTITDTYNLFVPEVKGNPVEFVQDMAAGAAHKSGSLAELYRREPFKPAVQ